MAEGLFDSLGWWEAAGSSPTSSESGLGPISAASAEVADLGVPINLYRRMLVALLAS